jgi:hypothetical protein
LILFNSEYFAHVKILLTKGRLYNSLFAGHNPPMATNLTKSPVVDLKRLVDKARADVALSNPVGFLIRLMGGEEFDGEKLSIRDRMDVAKFLTGRLVPNLESHEVTSEVKGMPPPLVISLNVTPQESMKVVSDQAKRDKNASERVEAVVSGYPSE